MPLLPASCSQHWAGASAHVPPGSHVSPDPTWLPAVVCISSTWQRLFWAGRARCTQGSPCTGRALQGTAQGTPPPASQGTHSLPSHPSPLLLRSPRQPVGQRGAVRAHGAGYQPMDRERGRGRAYSSSWRSGRPLKEGRGKWVKGRWHSPREDRADSGVGDRRVVPCHSPAPHGHLCSLVLRGCPAGKRDGVRGGGDRGHMG